MFAIFQKNEQKEFYVERLFREAKEIERSNYFYSEKNKLYPDDEDFYQNSSWTNYILKLYKKDKFNRFKRSDYFYEGADKLFPNDELFFDNATWTIQRKNQYKNKTALSDFKKNFLKNNQQQNNKANKRSKQIEIKASKKERSSYYYSGRGKLFPEDKDFVENATWSVSLLKLYKEDKLNRMRRSNYFYEAEDKLFPEDELFFDNTTWTFLRKKQHKNKKERMLPNFKTGFLRNNNQKSFLKDN